MKLLSERRQEFEEVLEEFFIADKRALVGKTVDTEILERLMYSTSKIVAQGNGLTWSEVFGCVARIKTKCVEQPVDYLALKAGR